MELQTPYLLFLGNAQHTLSVKIANSVVDWRPEVCIGEYRLPDCKISKGLPVLTPAAAKQQGARTFVITLNNSGGYIEPDWVPAIIEAMAAGLDVASGLHERLTEHPEIAAAAAKYGRKLCDVRHCAEPQRTGSGAKRSGRRLLTTGTDCSVGKMYTALALEKELRARGVAADFVATGQCGIFVSGRGLAVDAVVADFLAGAVEDLTPDNAADHWDVIEGQGSLSHPSFAGVSLGLLHGSQPDALVLCHAEGREQMRGVPGYEPPPLQQAIETNLEAARLTNPNAEFVGVSVNTSVCSEKDSQALLARYESELQLPCTDPIRFGVANIVDGIPLQEWCLHRD